jgi:hypothetical protein
MPLHFSQFFPERIDGCPGLYSYAEIEKVLLFVGYDVCYDQLTYAYSQLRKRVSTRDLVDPVREGNVYKFTSAGACLIARFVTSAQVSETPHTYTLQEILAVNRELGFNPDPAQYASLLGYRRKASLTAKNLRENLAITQIEKPEKPAFLNNSTDLRQSSVNSPNRV